jgi:hypothetical protein
LIKQNKQTIELVDVKNKRSEVLNSTNSPGMMNKLGLIKNIDGLLVYYTSDGLMCLQIDKSLLNELKH